MVTGICDFPFPSFLFLSHETHTVFDHWMFMLHYIPADPLLYKKNYEKLKSSVHSMNHMFLLKYENDFK